MICSNCRRTTGSAFKPFAGIERDKLIVTQGEGKLMLFGDVNANDTHCRLCGSLLYSVVRNGGFVHVALGTLMDGPTIRPSAHIFVGSKAPWFTITDGLPQFEEFPRFMAGVKEVKQLDDTHVHWHAEIWGKDKEWDAEITEQVPDQVIA